MCQWIRHKQWQSGWLRIAGHEEHRVHQGTPSFLDNAVAQILKTKLTFLSQLAVREKSHFTNGFFFSLLFSKVVSSERSFAKENASDEVSRKAVKKSARCVPQCRHYQKGPENEGAHCAALQVSFRE